MRSARQIFIAIYWALDAAFEKFESDGLRLMLSDMNPFLWQEGESADRAVWADYLDGFRKEFGGNAATDAASLPFAQAYVKKQEEHYRTIYPDGPSYVSAFDSVANEGNWSELLDKCPVD